VSPLVLVVEDDLTTNLALQGILAGAGFRTATAGDVAGAWAGIREHQPDLVLLDVNLPDGSGFEICQKLQQGPGLGRIPVLFISANNDLAAKVRGFAAGGVDYISKPLAGAEVLARVGTHLRLKQAYEELVDLQAERLDRLAAAQQNTMPQPQDLPEARFQVALKQKLEAGGDFYDVITSGENSVDYLVADASGHDLAASYWTAALKALVAEYANPLNSPADVLRALNIALGRILPSGAFFTLIYARLNRRSHRLSLANAGHPPAIITTPLSREPLIQWQEGDVVGAFADPVFGVTEMTLRPGDRLFLYSDGVVENSGSIFDGVSRLAAACQARAESTLADLVPSVLDEVTARFEVADDRVLLAVDA
jgi:sigma-B regulation protein RsbU (phosphoserine phosphatase)